MSAPKQQSMIEKLGFSDPDLSTPQHDAIMCWLADNAERLIADYRVADSQRSEIWARRCKLGRPIGIVWERPVFKGEDAYRTLVGALDMAVGVTCTLPSETLVAGKWEQSADVSVHGFVGFEVKSSIRSAGELLRQMNVYREYAGACAYAVVCPDDRFAKIIEGQGIWFIKAPRVI